jgi:hypothetical protein
MGSSDKISNRCGGRVQRTRKWDSGLSGIQSKIQERPVDAVELLVGGELHTLERNLGLCERRVSRRIESKNLNRRNFVHANCLFIYIPPPSSISNLIKPILSLRRDAITANDEQSINSKSSISRTIHSKRHPNRQQISKTKDLHTDIKCIKQSILQYLHPSRPVSTPTSSFWTFSA